MTTSIVTGGAGFIGSNLARALANSGSTVTVIDNLSTGHVYNLEDASPGVRLVRGDVRDSVLLRREFEGADIVFHQAALPSVPRSVDDPCSSHDHNANGTLNVLVAARDAGVRRVVYAASSSVYGNNLTLPKHEGLPASPQSPYAVAKHVGELYCKVFHEIYGLETVALRYFNVFGPRQDPKSAYAAVIPRFITTIERGESPVINGDGNQTRDFTFIENVVSANILAAEASAQRVSGETFNVGCGERVSINWLHRTISDILGATVEPIHGPDRPGDVRDSLASIEKAGAAFGYSPVVDVRKGLEVTVDWFTRGRAS